LVRNGRAPSCTSTHWQPCTCCSPFLTESCRNLPPAQIADTLVKRLQQDGTYQIVNTGQADAILYCTITRIDRNALRSVQNNVLATSEFGLTVYVRFEVVDQSTGARLMSGERIGRASFFSGNDLQTVQRQAMSSAASDIANTLASQITEGW
jgi:hypothetical protein